MNQERQLNSLHWFQSVQRKFKNDRVKIKEQGNTLTNNDDIKLRQTLTLTEKRIALFEKVNFLNTNINFYEPINHQLMIFHPHL